jgi:hypothetical protein
MIINQGRFYELYYDRVFETALKIHLSTIISPNLIATSSCNHQKIRVKTSQLSDFFIFLFFETNERKLSLQRNERNKDPPASSGQGMTKARTKVKKGLTYQN